MADLRAPRALAVTLGFAVVTHRQSTEPEGTIHSVACPVTSAIRS